MSYNCLEFNEKIIDGLYESLPEAELSAFGKHADSCQGCGELLGNFGDLRRHYHQLENLSPTPATLQQIFTFAEKFKIPPQSSLVGRLLGWTREGFSLRWAPAMVLLLMAISLTLSLTSPRKDVPPQNPSQVLRDRLLTNPFDEPWDDLRGRGPVIQRAALEDGPYAIVPPFNLTDLENIFKQRQRTLLETDADTLMMRGRRLKAMGSVELALKDFETIYYFYPEYSYMSDVLMYRAQCYALLGDKTRARESLQEILKNNPSKKEIVNPLLEQLSR